MLSEEVVCYWLANFHVTPMRISSRHWNKAEWFRKEIQWIGRRVVDITVLNFWKSGNSLSLEYSWNKKEYQIGVTPYLNNAFKRDHTNNNRNAIMSKYCFQFALCLLIYGHSNKILNLKFPVFQDKGNFHKREENLWSCRFTRSQPGKLFSVC